MVVLWSTNISSCDLALLKQIAHKTCNVDLSTAKRDATEAIRALARLDNPDLVDNQAIYNTEFVQKHFFFSYIVAVPEKETFDFVAMFEDVRLTLVPTDRATLVIASGTLDCWFNLITRYSVKGTSVGVLPIINSVQQSLELQGLAPLFNKYTKRLSKDVFYLEYNP